LTTPWILAAIFAALAAWFFWELCRAGHRIEHIEETLLKHEPAPDIAPGSKGKRRYFS